MKINFLIHQNGFVLDYLELEPNGSHEHFFT